MNENGWKRDDKVELLNDGTLRDTIERLVNISIENEWKKTRTWATIERISDQMKTCSE